MNSPYYYDLIFVITGPDNSIYYKSNLDFFSNKTHHPIIVGNGFNSIINEGLEGELIDTLIYLNKVSWFNASKVLFYIQAHGLKEEINYYLNLGFLAEIKLLFSLISETLAKPVDIILVSCYGKLAIPYLNYLPQYSNIVLLADENSSINPSNIIDIFEIMATKVNFSLDSFYYHYLATLPNNQSPIIIKLPNIFIDPLPLAHIFLKKPINDEKKEYINKNFAHSICYSSPACYDKINKAIEKLENSNSLGAPKEDNKKYWDLLHSLQNWQTTIKLNMINESCTNNLVGFKEKIDHYLATNEFPLELDLNYFGWNKQVELNEDLQQMSSRELYNVLIRSFFNKNNNFPAPEYLEIGFLYGVINDLSLYLYNN